jgi:trehalose 6-phosphate synthase
MISDLPPAESCLTPSGLTMAAPPLALAEEIGNRNGYSLWPRNPEENEASAYLRHRPDLISIDVDRADFDAWWSVFTYPILWFANHKTWDLPNNPDFRRQERTTFERHLRIVDAVTKRMIQLVEAAPVVYGYGYRLLFALAEIRMLWPDAEIHQQIPTAWGDPGDLMVLPDDIRVGLFDALTAADTLTFPTPADARRFLRCCEDVYGLEVDLLERRVQRGNRKTLVRSQLPLTDVAAALARSQSPAVLAAEEELMVRRRQYVLLAATEVELSANLLRTMTSFDSFLENRPEFREIVTFKVFVWSRDDSVSEYEEYLERIEALAAVVNHRHGSSDWMPLDMAIHSQDKFPPDHLLAAMRQFDLFLTSPLREGANAVPQIAAAVNQRDGLLALSSASASGELFAPHALSFNPYDLESMEKAIWAGLSTPPAERSQRAAEMRVQAMAASQKDWLGSVLEPIPRGVPDLSP